MPLKNILETVIMYTKETEITYLSPPVRNWLILSIHEKLVNEWELDHKRKKSFKSKWKMCTGNGKRGSHRWFIEQWLPSFL